MLDVYCCFIVIKIMGNQICCDENHQKTTELEKLEDEVVQKISVVERVPLP